MGYSLYQAATTCRAWCRSCSIRSTSLCGVAIYYSLMIALAATSVWLGRNQTLFDFWFYITNFSRYPMEIYRGRVGHAAAAGVHVRHSGAGGGERAGADAGPAAAAAIAERLAPARVRHRGHGRPAWPARAGCFSGRWGVIAARAVEANR